ncbi:MAG: hypothetical protein B6242_06855 [Anaerolineaceae bacterium 4572_78]|nr:MAG: hypothetical protein B6242_06855 [Anaerolineaceae bacterium 4572_78]
MYNSDRLQKIETEWESIEQSYLTDPYITPQNRAEEYQKVMESHKRGEPYNPQFVYLSPPEFPIHRIRRFMGSLDTTSSPIEDLYFEKARNELLILQCLLSHAPADITAMTCLIHGMPDAKLLKESKHILATIPTDDADEPQTVSAETAASKMQKVLDAAGIEGWHAVVKEKMNAELSVKRLEKQVQIRKGIMLPERDLRRLIVHEIGVHVIRIVNGSRQPIKVFQAMPGYMTTEEGIAVYSEYRADLLKNETLRKYAARVIAANLSLSQPFSQVFATIVKDVEPITAFEIAARAKRGFTDTAQPGSHVKDLVYFKGFLLIKDHLEKHPDDYPVLFTGKFALHHLPLVKSLLAEKRISMPSLLPDDLMQMPAN